MVVDLGRRSSQLATSLGIVGLGSWVSLILLFVVGGPFGVINDLGNGALGLLSGILGVTLWRVDSEAHPGQAFVGSSVATLGAIVTVVGSVLILLDVTGFFLAGLVSSAGFAVVGVWLIASNRGIASDTRLRWPRRHLRLGVVAGAVMALGFISVPGIVTGLDNMDSAPGWIQAGGVSWLGTYILFPIWSIWFGRELTRSAKERSDTETAPRHPAG